MLGLQAKLGRHGQANYLELQGLAKQLGMPAALALRTLVFIAAADKNLRVQARREARSMPLRGARAPSDSSYAHSTRHVICRVARFRQFSQPSGDVQSQRRRSWVRGTSTKQAGGAFPLARAHWANLSETDFAPRAFITRGAPASWR
jgi:hypothetical protein